MRSSIRPVMKDFLLWLAHDAVEAHSQGQPTPVLSVAAESFLTQYGDTFFDQGFVREHHGAFVSWYLHGQLQGCIGTFQRSQPLWKTIQQMAIHAATQDPRFPAVTVEQLPHLRCEISVLLPPEPISGPEDIEVGRDGLIVETDTHRGVLLPQVATKREWNAVEFLQHTCVKARLPQDAWEDLHTRLYRFEALVLEE